METVKAPDSHPEIILERLIQENQVSLKRLCYLYLHDEDMAEDAVQETFLKMYRSLSDYRGEANERTYLTRIAINTCKDMLRSGWFRHIDRRITVDALPRSEEIKDPYHCDIAVAVMNLPRKLREVADSRLRRTVKTYFPDKGRHNSRTQSVTYAGQKVSGNC